MKYELEAGEVVADASACPICGGNILTLTGLIEFANNGVCGLYFADWCEGEEHEEPVAIWTVSAGQCDDRGEPETTRRAFCVRVDSNGVTALPTPTRGHPELGRFVPPEDVPDPREESVPLWLTLALASEDDAHAVRLWQWLNGEIESTGLDPAA